MVESRQRVESPLATDRGCGLLMALLASGISLAGGMQWVGATRGEPAGPTAAPTMLLIDANRASVAEWSLLPGIGPVLAERIVRDRRQRGDFSSLQELARVEGVGAKTIEQIKPYLVILPATTAAAGSPRVAGSPSG